MAGYNGYSKSNNATAAEDEGRLPLSRAIKAIAERTGCSQKDARTAATIVGATEWHHTSKRYNHTDYYDVEAIVRYLNARPVIDSLPENWRGRMDAHRNIRGEHRLDVIGMLDQELADELGVGRETLESEFYGAWEID